MRTAYIIILCQMPSVGSKTSTRHRFDKGQRRSAKATTWQDMSAIEHRNNRLVGSCIKHEHNTANISDTKEEQQQPTQPNTPGALQSFPLQETTTATMTQADTVVVASLSYLRPEVAALQQTLQQFVQDEVIPAEAEYAHHMKGRHGTDRWTMDAIPPCLFRLQQRAKSLGLWNLFLPPRLISHLPRAALAEQLQPAIALSYREYGILCETMGRSIELCPQATNCSAPDTGNSEVLLEFGTPQQQETYLLPLLRGDIRSTFLMTEPDVASSDPTNLETKLTKILHKNGGVEYVLTGRKWWSTGAMDPRCRVALVVAKMDYSHPSCSRSSSSTSETNDKDENKHGAHTIVLVPLPHPGVRLVRPLTVFGYDDAPFGHAEVVLDHVQLSTEHLILGEGSGFRVSQARLGPGRIHHCMRAIGMGKFRSILVVVSK
jgi:alkylation response protein AidB-like acyl-CoA dehydrogenase